MKRQMATKWRASRALRGAQCRSQAVYDLREYEQRIDTAGYYRHK
jgi:hypothetical protein